MWGFFYATDFGDVDGWALSLTKPAEKYLILNGKPGRLAQVR
jgi:hypothetical protein